ncbi:hypothetical protein OX283_007020 [Flavobacterium sp. SUN052]|uniref:hypothetical protein n=1 Tax=Flavobacterium sp. SUN052 TaxID=3002441 RepID=UPI00237DAF07|nr:hypothetical protein [Flavobacterium sp. SUN052]MEC4004401.1 hypothetical protein [Flavobacterium sp. SUN052]
MDYSKIALLSTVANFELYDKTSLLFPSNVQKYVIDGTNGMHGIHSILYMMRKLKNKGIDWLIMADEDVVFYDSKIIFSIIEKMQSENLTVCGVRDGGTISHRNQNPYGINTFFSILNFKEIEAIWNEKEMLKNQYVIENEFPDDLSTLDYKYDVSSIYEPYYCFYFWLRRKGKQFLFLETAMDEDAISNYIYYQGKPFLCHTWYARSYSVNAKHTQRINTIISKSNIDKIAVEPSFNSIIFYKNTTFALEQKIKKIYRKFSRRLFK